MFDILRKNGITARMDETIGTDFFDMSKVTFEIEDND